MDDENDDDDDEGDDVDDNYVDNSICIIPSNFCMSS